MPAPRATEAAIRRAIAVWKDAGLSVGKLEVTPDGGIIITAPEPNAEAAVSKSGPKQWPKIG